MTFLGIDIGTSSTKGVLTDRDGAVVRQARREHATSSPQPGWFEHDAEAVWWADFVGLCADLVEPDDEPIHAVCVSGIGPAILLTDENDRPLRPAILYGIDTRSKSQVEALNDDVGAELLLAHCGNVLSTQSVGPKLTWVAEEEPETWHRARRLYSAPGWIVRRLTGEYTIDRYSASASDPLYDLAAHRWWDTMWEPYDVLERPRLASPSEVVGAVSAEAAPVTGIPAGTPVVAGTVDALAEAYSVGCRDVGDTMLMYGSTLFMVQVAGEMIPTTHLWASEGRTAGTFSLAAGMSTGGLVASWLADVLGEDYATLAAMAKAVPAGSEGLMFLPYLAGERTPILDPDARGSWVGLTLAHTPAHLYRSALEGVAMGIRHNLDWMSRVGAAPQRLVAVGGGTEQRVWTQIVSDVTGLPQDVPTLTVGASYGDARMAADAVGVDTSSWNPTAERLVPDAADHELYQRIYDMYVDLHPVLASTMHRLGALATSPGAQT